MAAAVHIDGFRVAADDPLADEHRAVEAWIDDALASLGEHRYWQDVDLKSLPSGAKLLDATPEQARRYVVAAVAQARYWDRAMEQVRAQAASEAQRINPHSLPGWDRAWGSRRQAGAVVSTLMRRNLPFQKQDLLDLIEWCIAADNLSTYTVPLGAIARALQRYAAQEPLDGDLAHAMRQFASRLRSSHDKQARRQGTAIEQLCAESPDPAEAAHADDPPPETKPAPQPAPAGTPGVLEPLKRLLKMLPPDPEPSATLVGPDDFPLTDDSPLPSEHELLSGVLEEVVGTENYCRLDLRHLKAGRKLLELPPLELGTALLAAAERHVHALLARTTDYTRHELWQSRSAAAGVFAPLGRRPFSAPRPAAFDLLLYLAVLRSRSALCSQLISLVERDADESPLAEGECYVLSLFRASLITGPPLGAASEEVTRLTRLIGDAAAFCLVPGETWTDAVNDDFSRLTPAQRRAWAALWTHALTATASRPSARWLKTAGKLLEDIGGDELRDALARWLPLVAQGRTIPRLAGYSGDTRGAADTMHEENATALRGLIWLVQLLPRHQQLVRHLGSVALSAYKKVPGVGPRAVKVGNAAVYALSVAASEDAVGELAMLKVRVKFGTAQKEIEKAFNATAAALGLPPDQIEEMGVPSYGLEPGGVRRETLGDYTAELLVTGSDAQFRWFDAKGKSLKSVPARVKKDHGEELKELQQSLKDIQRMLPAQRDRIDSLFLLEKSWPIDLWCERYLSHPLVGTIAQRLIWCVDGTPALFIDGQPADVSGNAIEHGRTADITLWHPVGRSIEEITAWRRRLEQLQITQPFKQAHREVYLLTDAERNTRTYSNRFAAHILRQHQFNALCAARGWKNRLRLMVDDAYPPAYRELPEWGLRAEFWVEGIGDGYGTDTNESGVYLRLAADQVRFYRSEAAQNYAHAGGGGYTIDAAGPGQNDINEPLPLEQVPPLVFSEAMRDVDLFVGVASVGNDPTWQDGGPEGRYRDYWHSYSFGELSGTAATRKQVLERLVPRLKIADRCSFSDRFLVVRGDKRTYKIHLGSANILMEPNDQYLCIVPDSRSRAKQDDLFLPFEGDNVLSIILSKALLLAADTKIKDPTITRQIDGG